PRSDFSQYFPILQGTTVGGRRQAAARPPSPPPGFVLKCGPFCGRARPACIAPPQYRGDHLNSFDLSELPGIDAAVIDVLVSGDTRPSRAKNARRRRRRTRFITSPGAPRLVPAAVERRP